MSWKTYNDEVPFFLLLLVYIREFYVLSSNIVWSFRFSIWWREYWYDNVIVSTRRSCIRSTFAQSLLVILFFYFLTKDVVYELKGYFFSSNIYIWLYALNEMFLDPRNWLANIEVSFSIVTTSGSNPNCVIVASNSLVFVSGAFVHTFLRP